MGLDATGCFRTPKKMTDSEVAELELKIKACFYPANLNCADTHTLLIRPYYADHVSDVDRMIEIDFDCDRLWDPQYRRGPFLAHLTICGWLLRNLPPGSKVFYGGDTLDLHCLEEWTTERESEYLEAWLLSGRKYDKE